MYVRQGASPPCPPLGERIRVCGAHGVTHRAHLDTATGAPVSDPAGIEKHPETRRIGDRRSAVPVSNPMGAPTGVVTRSGDRSVVLHWQCDARADLTGYCVYRAQAEDGRFAKVTPQPVPLRGFADLNLTNGRTYLYRVRAVGSEQQESPDSESVSSRPMGFANDEDFLSYLQQTAFDYFWYEANPANGLIRDRSRTNSYCSIAAVGFGLTAIGIGIDHGWITREQGRERVLQTLKTFHEKPESPNVEGNIGYKGWFYHF